MDDTIINSPVLEVFDKNTELSSSEVAALIKQNMSLVTVKRQLSVLNKAGFLSKSGAGRSVKYKLSKRGLLLRPFNTKSYLSKALDERLTDNHFQFDIFEKPFIELFSSDELTLLESATNKFRSRSKLTDQNARKKEFMRFIIEFSWKTSQIEGNTYDLISTEKLLLYGEISPNNTEFEAQMILNQKNALEFSLDLLRNLFVAPSSKFSSL